MDKLSLLDRATLYTNRYNLHQLLAGYFNSVLAKVSTPARFLTIMINTNAPRYTSYDCMQHLQGY
jgi:hypothetical protein